MYIKVHVFLALSVLLLEKGRLNDWHELFVIKIQILIGQV